ncbi:hypothetical protein ACQYAD_12090 [Neobacillus sp. SM06]|uniref:hypothetical protein n=1 Tax=Neobacillus sp. SM06 TaxID=3422492 RepID=UPI003D2D59EC
MEMEQQKQYREDLLEWCNHIYLHWESMKPQFINHSDPITLEEWEESHRELTEKLDTDGDVEFDDYRSAKKLYESWEHLCSENQAYQEKAEAEFEKNREMQQYREQLLEWCNNLHFHWESMRTKFSKMFDLRSLEEWEETYRELTEKLQTEDDVPFDAYETAQKLYEGWNQLYCEASIYDDISKAEMEMVNPI